jgi:hypothetical protein
MTILILMVMLLPSLVSTVESSMLGADIHGCAFPD